MLLGYRNAREIVILDSIGAGPSAVHAEARFEPDGAWQRERLGEIYRASDGVVTYLGDWHTHPEGWPLPSEQDLATAANVAGHKRARVSQPITLIAGSWPEGMLLRAYLFAESDLVPLQLVEFRPEFFYEARLPGFVSSHSEAFLRPLLDRVRRLGSAREMFQNE